MSSTRRIASLAAVLPVLLVTGNASARADTGTRSSTGDATFKGLGGRDRSQGRRWTDHLEFLFGLACVDVSADLKVTRALGNLKAGRDADRIAPTIGLQLSRET